MTGKYDAWRMYGQAKLANRHFAMGLDRQFRSAGLAAKSLSAHPGLARTDLQGHTVEEGGGGVLAPAFDALNKVVGMQPEQGVLPQLRAATDPDAPGGGFYGPRFFMTGAPDRHPLVRPRAARAIESLWAISRDLTGVDVDVRAALAH